MKTHLLFDLDGTLTDPRIGITKSVQYSLAHFGISIADPDELIAFIGPPLRDSYRERFGFDEETAEAAVAKYREYFSRTGIFENTVYDGIPALLERLHASRTLVVATSKPTVYAEKILRHFQMDRFFRFVAGSELDGRRSRKGAVILHAMARVQGLSAENALMIGDRKHDIQGASETGMDSVGVTYGYGSAGELQNAGATHIAHTVPELSDLLASL